jgi:hypothetical protein
MIKRLLWRINVRLWRLSDNTMVVHRKRVKNENENQNYKRS